MKQTITFLAVAACAVRAQGAPATASAPAVSDSIDLPLKNGTMYTFTCPSPMVDQTNISAGNIKAAMAKVEGALYSACGGKDFSSKDTCDMCWKTVLTEAQDFIVPNTSNQTQLAERLKDGEADIAIMQTGEVDFSNGCPWMKACLGVFENAMSTATIEGLGEDMVNFFDQCDGAADGIDFPKAILSSILELEPLLKGLGVDTSEMDATIASLSGDMPSAAPSTAPSKAPSTPSKSSGLVATLGSAAIASAVVGLLI